MLDCSVLPMGRTGIALLDRRSGWLCHISAAYAAVIMLARRARVGTLFRLVLFSIGRLVLALASRLGSMLAMFTTTAILIRLR